jgi:hypothetical protein
LGGALFGRFSTLMPVRVMSDLLRVELGGDSGGHCECCGNETRTIWGYVHSGDQAIASYFLQWTRRMPQHLPNLDFLIRPLGQQQTSPDWQLVSWVFNPVGGGFMAIDSAARPAAKSPLCNRALTRDEVITNGDLMELTTGLIDAVWLGDPRVQEVQALANDA